MNDMALIVKHNISIMPVFNLQQIQNQGRRSKTFNSNASLEKN